MFRLRLVPQNTHIAFMKGRIAGLIVSALLSLLSVLVFFTPGLNYGIDFKGGIVIEARAQQAFDFSTLRDKLGALGLGEVALQEFGSPSDVLIRVGRQDNPDAEQAAVTKIREEISLLAGGTEIRRVEVVGGKISEELFQSGLIALAAALAAMLGYIWFRFEWNFAVGAVITLILDITKIVGFYAITQLQFNLTSVAAILTIIGYSINDKVVVYDRMRENLRKYKTMSLRNLIDLSINESLARTVNTSFTTFLAMLPLALFGGDTLQGFGLALLFGIVVGTSSSIFIAAPILLFLGEATFRRRAAEAAEAERGA